MSHYISYLSSAWGKGTAKGVHSAGQYAAESLLGVPGAWCSERSQCSRSSQALVRLVLGRPYKRSQPFLMTLLSDDGADYVALLLSDWGMSVDSHIVWWMQVDPWEVSGRVALWCHRSARVASKVWKKACYTLIVKPIMADEDEEHMHLCF